MPTFTFFMLIVFSMSTRNSRNGPEGGALTQKHDRSSKPTRTESYSTLSSPTHWCKAFPNSLHYACTFAVTMERQPLGRLHRRSVTCVELMASIPYHVSILLPMICSSVPIPAAQGETPAHRRPRQRVSSRSLFAAKECMISPLVSRISQPYRGLFGRAFLPVEVIGSGAFGFVCSVRQWSNSVLYAIKVAPSTEVSSSECSIMATLPPHGSLVRYIGHWEEPRQQENAFLDSGLALLEESSDGSDLSQGTLLAPSLSFLQMELCTGPSLKEAISHELDADSITHIVRGILRGLSHLHENGIIHCMYTECVLLYR